MPVTITGGRYAIRSLSAAATTTVTIATGTFVSGDFGATQRMVSLHSSTGAFKGIAWVRRFVSTTQLELEGQFVDPVTGLFATQVVGDQVMVSKNSAESAAAGWAVTTPDNNVVTVTDNVVMGTAGSEVSLCFYDENKQFTMTNGFRFNGGVAVFGKLISYDGVSKESFVWSRECTARPNENYPLAGSPAYNLWGTGGTSAHMFFFGGAVGSPMRRSFFIGAEGTAATNKTFAFYGTRLYHACASPSNGGNWASNPERHLLYKTIHEADYSNANLIVWGNGAFQGSFLSFSQYGAGSPLGVFRASGAVTFGASANNRTIVADVGSGAFIDDINNGTYTFTNTITPSVNIARHPGGATPITFQFSDDYTNLKARSTVVLVRASDSATVSSVVNTASTTFTATVVQATYSATANGTATPTAFYTAFNYTAKCYGYQTISGTHSTYTYSLGTAGNGTDLKLGGLINQVADTGVTLTETQALALSSKFTFNSGTNTWTVTANATYDEWYDFTIGTACSSAALARVPSLTQYPLTWNGTALTAYTGSTIVVNAGVTFAEGAKFKSFFCPTVTNNGSITGIYSNGTGTSKTVELTVSAGSSIYVGDSATSITRLFNSTVGAGTYRVFYAPSATAPTVLIARELYGFQRFAQVVTLADGLNSFTPVDIPDVGISEPTLATVLAYTAIDGPSKRYDRTAAFRLTEQGIKLGQIATRSGTSLEGTFSIVVRDDAPVVYGVTGNVITIKAASYEADSRFVKEVVTGGGTFTAFDTELITIDIEDSNGDSSVLVQGTTGGLVDVWKCVNGTINADYETGTKIASDISAGKFRFTGVNGFKLIFFDKNTLLARDCLMAKGSYTLGWYLYDAPTGGLTQEQNVNFSTMVTKVSEIFNDVNSVTNGFVESTDSLHTLRAKIDTIATDVWSAPNRELQRTTIGNNTGFIVIEAAVQGASFIRVQEDLPDFDILDLTGKTVDIKVQWTPVARFITTPNIASISNNNGVYTLTFSTYIGNGLPEDVAIGASLWVPNTVVNPLIYCASALSISNLTSQVGTPLQAADYVAPANAEILATKTAVENIQPTDLSGIPGAVRTELATELGRIDAAVSTRSTLTAEDIPKGLTAAEVWSATERTLTTASGLTPEQEATLNAIPTLAEIENSSALAKEATTSAIRAKTDNLPANPAAVGSQMTLTSAYDAAKNAATQASLDAIGTPLQAGDVVDANIVKINNKPLQGAGVPGDSFRPV